MGSAGRRHAREESLGRPVVGDVSDGCAGAARGAVQREPAGEGGEERAHVPAEPGRDVAREVDVRPGEAVEHRLDPAEGLALAGQSPRDGERVAAELPAGVDGDADVQRHGRGHDGRGVRRRAGGAAGGEQRRGEDGRERRARPAPGGAAWKAAAEAHERGKSTPSDRAPRRPARAIRHPDRRGCTACAGCRLGRRPPGDRESRP